MPPGMKKMMRTRMTPYRIPACGPSSLPRIGQSTSNAQYGSHSTSTPPIAGPRIVETPPMTSPAMNSMERCKPNVSGPIVVAASAKQPPPIEVTNALVANASTLYCAGYTPDTAAPVSLSRIAIKPRPTELLTRFEVITNISRAMTKTVANVQSLVVQPCGAHDGGFQWKPSVFVTSPLLMTLPLLPPVMLAKSMPKKLSDLTIAGNANARPSVISDRYSPRIRSAGIPMTAPTAKPSAPATGSVARNGHPWSAIRIIVV